jgi:predicted peroxiredoxin
MADRKRMLYVQTSGINRPERAYAPLVLATTAASMGIDATVYFLGSGVGLVKQGEAERIRMGDSRAATTSPAATWSEPRP